MSSPDLIINDFNVSNSSQVGVQQYTQPGIYVLRQTSYNFILFISKYSTLNGTSSNSTQTILGISSGEDATDYEPVYDLYVPTFAYTIPTNYQSGSYYLILYVTDTVGYSTTSVQPVSVTGISATTVNVASFSINNNASISASSFVTGVSNPSGDNITQYGFYNSGTDGYFTVGGVAQANGQWVDVAAANIGSVAYVGGASYGIDTLEVEVYDATLGQWTNPATLTATTTTTGSTWTLTPSSTTANEYVPGGSTITFTLTRSSATTSETVALSTVQKTITGASSPNNNYYAKNYFNYMYKFDVGQYTQSFTININDLGLTAGSESFTFIAQSQSQISANPDQYTTYLARSAFTINNNAKLSQNTSDLFSGDGQSDVLWRNANGDVTLWNSSTSGAYSNQDLGVIGNDWQVVGVGDFNGATADGVLWRNVNGDLTTWNSASNSPESFSANGGTTYHVGLDWRVAAVGDFNGDGRSDILWSNVGGLVDIWNANSSASPTSFTFQPAIALTSDWRVAGVGDFSGSGTDGILWRNASGVLTTWNSTAAAPESFSGNGGATCNVGLDWQVAGVGDFNGDGRADILWRNNGSIDLWYANSGSGPVAFTPQSPIALSSVWAIQNVGDYNGDGFADILLRNTASGDVVEWLSNGAGGFSSTDIAVVGSDWTVQKV